MTPRTRCSFLLAAGVLTLAPYAGTLRASAAPEASPTATPTPETARRHEAVCRENLRRIHEALARFRRDRGDYPLVLTRAEHPGVPPLQGLYPRYLSDPKVFLCPAASEPLPFPNKNRTTYAYTLGIGGPTFVRTAEGEQWRQFARQELVRFGKDFTLAWCFSHPAPPEHKPAALLSLKANGAVVWEPVGFTEEDRPEQFRRSEAFGRKMRNEPELARSPLVPVGSPAPEFRLPTPDGTPLGLPDLLRGKKAVLVNFWFYH